MNPYNGNFTVTMELGSVDDTMAGSSDIASGPALQVVVNGMIDAEIESDHGKV